ncbi:hypothetical protein G4B88_029841, partial [Cannabis sativa]
MEFPYFLVTLLVVLSLFSLSTTTFAVVDTIRPSEILRDNNNTAILVSKQGTFALGFFTPTATSSKNRYLGIWYNKITGNQTVVWVANRCEPIKDSSSSLTINNKGNLVLFSGHSNNRVLVWSTNSSKQAREPLVQLLDDGNLVLRDDKDSNTTKYLWESFDYPTDTMLPGMILGWDLKKGLNRRLSSWKSSDDPCHGDLTYGIELDEPDHIAPQLLIRNGSSILYREGPWRGVSFGGTSNYVSVFWKNSGYEFVHNKDEIYFTYNAQNNFVSCNDKEKDVFYLTTELKVPETKYTWASKSMKLDECNAKCISNCSCSAYGYNSNLDGSISDLAIGTECVLWFGDLFDTRNSKGYGRKQNLQKKHVLVVM